MVREDSSDDTERQLDQVLEEDCRIHNQFVYEPADFGSVHFEPPPGKVNTESSTPSLGTFASIPSTVILDPTPLPQGQAPSQTSHDSFHTLQDHPHQNYYHVSQDHNNHNAHQNAHQREQVHTPQNPSTPLDQHLPHSDRNHTLRNPNDLAADSNSFSTPGSSQPQTLDPSVLEGLDASGFAHFPYTIMKAITHDFTGLHVDEGGNKLGEGAFGVVFLASVICGGSAKRVAIKKLNAGEVKVEEQFKTEIEVLSRQVLFF